MYFYFLQFQPTHHTVIENHLVVDDDVILLQDVDEQVHVKIAVIGGIGDRFEIPLDVVLARVVHFAVATGGAVLQPGE